MKSLRKSNAGPAATADRPGGLSPGRPRRRINPLLTVLEIPERNNAAASRRSTIKQCDQMAIKQRAHTQLTIMRMPTITSSAMETMMSMISAPMFFSQFQKSVKILPLPSLSPKERA